jgi:hypothetical protein
MRFDPQAGITQLVADVLGRRAQPRVRQETLHSTLGQVLDISSGGARILTRERIAGLIEFRIFDSAESIIVTAEVLWTRRIGLFKREIGLRFVDLSPEIAAGLTRLATSHRDRRSIFTS